MLHGKHLVSVLTEHTPVSICKLIASVVTSSLSSYPFFVCVCDQSVKERIYSFHFLFIYYIFIVSYFLIQVLTSKIIKQLFIKFK